MACEWRERDGTRYLYADYRGTVTSTERLAVLEQVVGLIEEAGRGVLLVVHVNPSDSYDPAFLSALKSAMSTRMFPLGTRAAVVGVGGIGRVVMRGMQAVGGGTAAVAVRTEQEAVAFLSRPRKR